MKEEEKPPLRVVNHEQMTVTDRRIRGRDVVRRHRTWYAVTTRQRGRPGSQKKYTFNVPEWMLPKNGVHVWNTITASIVWGICGQMADVPEYQK